MKKKRMRYVGTVLAGAIMSCMIVQLVHAQVIIETPATNLSLESQEQVNVGTADLVINSVREMNEFAVKVNNSTDGYRGKVVKLGKDIEYTGINNYTPINNFCGTFDGCGYTIKGIQVSGSGRVGLFEDTSGAVLQNVTIENCSFSSSNNPAGGIVAYALNTTIKNCKNVNSTVSGNLQVGGIVGNGGLECTIINCSSSGKTEGSGQVGGIGGYVDTVYNSYNTGSVYNKSESYDEYAGGIAGHAGSIMNCYNTGNVSGKYAGGIAGEVSKNAIGNYCSEESSDINFNKMSGQESGNEAMSLSQMQADTFVQKLNDNKGNTHDDWLEWQKGNGVSYPQHVPLIRIGNATVTLSDSEYTYNGQEQHPSVTVSLAENVLVEGRDYEINYNNCKEPGTASVYVMGLGRYIDTVEKNYEILPLDLKTASITLSNSSYYYDGKEKKPDVTLSVNGTVLGKWDEYGYYEGNNGYDEDNTPWISMSFKNNINPGTATVTVTGSGTHYTGTISKTFKILKQNQTIVATSKYNKTYKDPAFSLNAYISKGDGTLSFKSSNSSIVSVNKNTGYATIKGTGSVIITITAKATTGYNEKKKLVTINVKPQKQSASLKTAKNRTMTVKWSKDKKATGYVLQYGTDKKFKKNTKEIKLKKNSLVSKKITKLKKGKTYYVRVCSYKTMKVNGKTVTLNGAWSKTITSGKIK